MEEIPNPIYLNKNWRVYSDGLQWILERRKGNQTKKNTGWKARKFNLDREKLLENIEKQCGDIHPDSRELLLHLPARHP